MKNITKADIVDSVSKATGITKVDTKAVLEGTLASIVEAISKGHKVEIRGFGVFYYKQRKARIARNPKTGDTVPLQERCVPLFKASGEFAQKVNSNISQNTGETIDVVANTHEESNSQNTQTISFL